MILVWVIGVLGALSIGVAGLVASTSTVPDTKWLVLVGLATLSADATYVNIRFGHNVEAYTWVEFSLVLGLALLPAEFLVLTSLLVAVAHVLARRSAVKVVFNTTSYAVGVVIAAGVTHGVWEPGWETPVQSALALAAGALAFSIWNGISVNAAIAYSQGLPFSTVYGKGWRLRLLVLVGNVMVGLSVLAGARWSQPTMIVLPPLVALVYAVYRGYLRALQDRDVWQQLEAAGKELSRLDEGEVAEAAVVRAASLFEADVIELSLAPADESGSSRVYVGGAGGVEMVREEPAYRMDNLALTTYRVVSQPSMGAAAEGSVETCVVAPLIGPRGTTGVLRVGFHGPVKLSKREHQLLTTFAHTVSATVQNARLYAEMRDQAKDNAHAAEHDSLTGLANRSLLQRRTNTALAKAAANGELCALLLVDLDHFKEINDTLGHTAGDALLTEIGTRLSAAVSLEDTVARLGGDEFAVLLPGIRSAGDADRVAERLLRVLAEPIDVDGLRLSIEGSMGVACYPLDGGTFEELFQRADVAMYQAKTARGSYSHYRSDLDDSSIQRLSLIADLREAIEGDQLVLHYQPQLDVLTGRAVGAEALVRWAHPTRGLLRPDEFVPLVEYSGLVRSFTNCIVDKAVAECSLWQQLGCDLTIAVNLSARNLLDRRLPLDIASALRRHGLPADRLVLEITETTILHELEVVEEVLGQLRRMGVILSVDDFGTGYSSLAFLQRVAVHELKIDRSFISNMTSNDNDEAIARATVQLAQSLGLRTVAEGVDCTATLDRVVALGCDTAQGYHFSQPVCGEEVRALLGVPAVAIANTVRLPRPRPTHRPVARPRLVDLR